MKRPDTYIKQNLKIVNLLLFLFFILVSCSGPFVNEYPRTFKVKVSNPSELARTDVVISLDLATIKKSYNDFNEQAIIFLLEDQELPCQLDESTGEVFFLTSLDAGEEQMITVRYNPVRDLKRSYTKRSQAELSHKFGGEFVDREYQGGEFKNVSELHVPAEHTDHSWFIRYEGPGWESDKVGYRFYLDWRNATDIFGKKTTDMILQNVGQDGFDSYHEMQPWGQDILKVGESLGIGSIAIWYNDKAERVAKTDSIYSRISSNGPIRSSVTTTYYGWQLADFKTDLVAKLTIDAGSRATFCELSLSQEPENICTGIVKHDSVEIIKSANENGWQYFATYGKQSLANDTLGMAVFYNQGDLIEITEDQQSHVIVLKPQNGEVNYYFLAAWQQEFNGITSQSDFADYLKDKAVLLNGEINVTIQ